MALAQLERPSGGEEGLADKTVSTVFTNDVESQQLLTVDAASLALGYVALCQREISDGGSIESDKKHTNGSVESHELRCLNGSTPTHTN